MKYLYSITLTLTFFLVTLTFISAHDLDTDGSEKIDDDKASADIDEAIQEAQTELDKDEKQAELQAEEEVKNPEGVDKTADPVNDLFSPQDEDTNERVKAALLQLSTLKNLARADQINPFKLKVSPRWLKIWKRKFKKYCTNIYAGPACDKKAIYRTIEGNCNNLKNPTWGAVFCPQLREIPPMYDDGVDVPRARDSGGFPLPSPRTVSNIVHSIKGTSPRNNDLTVMVMQWGQFIDHEFVATPVFKDENGKKMKCCGPENEGKSQCFPIIIPQPDDFFVNKTCMNFVRSSPVPNHECDPGFREQMNQVTSYIDGSAIYGSKKEIINDLRAHTGGLLRTVSPDQEMLPKNLPEKCRLDMDHFKEDYCQKAGDVRVNVIPSLGWSHTMLFREHNRIAKKLAVINPAWNDETLFQETRRIIAAIQQHINYNGYLPSILSRSLLLKYQLTLTKSGYASKYYKRGLNPTIANVFAVAAFRFGHSQIPDYQATMTKARDFDEKKNIEDTYHKPHMVIYEHGEALDGMARWLATDPTPLADSKFEDGTRNKLFLDTMGNSLDLPALNIQRGRDHGIPGYNHWRVHCNLAKATMVKDKPNEFVLPDHSDEATHLLEHAYNHVDDIDLFAGAMTEDLLEDSSVGATFACLLGSQFKRLKRGDRFWYETSAPRIRFEQDQLAEIKKITLARVLCDNFDVDNIQPDVFHTTTYKDNQRVACSQIPEIDLTKWKANCSNPVNGKPEFRQRKCRAYKKKQSSD